jgi:hypothetical protein
MRYGFAIITRRFVPEDRAVRRMAVLMLCAGMFLSFSLNAQTSPENSGAPYRISSEKADSLLIELSRKKSKKKEYPQNNAGATDPLSGNTLTKNASPAMAKLPAKIRPEMAEPSSADSVAAEPAEKNRKKASVARSGLLIEQEGGEIKLKNAGEVDYTDLRSVNEGSLLGIGGYRMKDSYLSPERYGGAGLRFMNERMRLTKLSDHKISRQNIVNVDISSTMNGAENANFLSAFVDYSVGYHYLFLPDPYFKIKAGGSARSMLGMVYNTRNGNNPLTVHADIDLNFSLIAIYEFRIRKHPLTVRYQLETPFAGMLFSPVYNQSYYEIFSLGNTAEIFNFNSFNNKFAIRSYLTFDFPIGGMTLRAGYFGTYYSTHIHSLDRYIISHNLMLGFVKEFVAFGGREMRKRNLFHSAYY